MNDFSWYTGNLPWLKAHTIFLTKHGSHAYGTNLPTSDLDLKGIAIAPKNYYLGFLQNFEQAEVRSPLDVVIYDIRKFFGLAADCNPNIIEVLFTNEEDWIIPPTNEDFYIWNEIHTAREQFLSKQARHTFSGYAISQLRRIQTHRRWLLSPPKTHPLRSHFGLRDAQGTLGRDQLGIVNAHIRRLEDTLAGAGATKERLENEELQQKLVGDAIRTLNLDMNLLPVIYAERRYAAASRTWDQYQKWKLERNPIRAEMEAQFGYDTKHAMHLVRLLRMAKEILGEAKVMVRRPDAEELLAIRAGAWKYDDLMIFAETSSQQLVGLAETSPLPRSPDRIKLDHLLVDLVRRSID